MSFVPFAAGFAVARAFAAAESLHPMTRARTWASGMLEKLGLPIPSEPFPHVNSAGWKAFHAGVMKVSTSVLAEVEVLRTLRKHHMNDEHAVTGFYLLSFDDEVRRYASEVGATTLRSLDAIHLATALSIGDRDLDFVTYDDRQAEAARQAGLKVVQPGR